MELGFPKGVLQLPQIVAHPIFPGAWGPHTRSSAFAENSMQARHQHPWPSVSASKQCRREENLLFKTDHAVGEVGGGGM